MIKKLLGHKGIYLEWADATATGEWGKPEDLGIDKCNALGFVVRETEEEISLAVASSTAEVNGTITIPKSWITYITEVSYSLPQCDS